MYPVFVFCLLIHFFSADIMAAQEIPFEGPSLYSKDSAQYAISQAQTTQFHPQSIHSDDRLVHKKLETYRYLLHPGDQAKYVVFGVLDHPIRIYLDSVLLFQEGSLDSNRSSTLFRASFFQIPTLQPNQHLIVQIFPKGSRMNLPTMWLMDYEEALRHSFWLTFWNHTSMMAILILVLGFGLLALIYAYLKKWEGMYLLFFGLSIAFPMCYAMVIFSNPIWAEYPLILLSRIGFLWAASFMTLLSLKLFPHKYRLLNFFQKLVWIPPIAGTCFLLVNLDRTHLEIFFPLIAKYWIIPCTIFVLLQSIYLFFTQKNLLPRLIVFSMSLVSLATLHDFYYFKDAIRPYCWYTPYSVLLLSLSIAVMIMNEYLYLTHKLIHRNKRLISAYRQAREAIQMRNSLIRNLSHELRTPSNALVEIFSTPHQINTPEAILAVIELSYHAESLIAVSSIHAKNFEINTYPFHLKLRMEQLALQLQKIAHSKNYSLEYSQTDLPYKAVGDMKRMELVFFELFQIVIRQSTHQSKIKIDASFQGDSLNLRMVFDTPNEDLIQQSGQLFKRNLDLNELFPEETKVAYWTFLGVLEKLGGSYQITPLDNQLYEISVQIHVRPILKDLPVDQSLRILVVDNLPINRLVLEGVLENLGYEVTLAENGIQAIEKTLAYNPHLIFMDIQMPVMDGLTATEILRNTHQINIPIFALTAHAERTECLNAGMDDYLTKPIRKDEIQSMIEQWFGEQST